MNRQLRLGLPAALLAALLSGCAVPGSSTHQPARLDAATLKLESLPEGPISESWWLALQDPRLDQLIRNAWAHSPSLDLADARLARARAEAGLAQSETGPKVDAKLSADRQRYSRYGLTPEPIANNYYTTYTVALQGRWDLDLWGRHRAQLDAALGKVRAAELEQRETRRTLTRAVVAQYTTLQRAMLHKQLATQRLATQQQRIELMRQRVAAGLASADSLDTLNTGRALLSQQDNDYRRDIDMARHALAELTGQAPDALATLQTGEPSAPPAVPTTRLTANLLGQRPDILARKAEVEASEAATRAAKAAFFPDLSLTAFIGLSSLETGTWMTRDARSMGVAPALTLPIFHSGELNANLAREKAGNAMAIAAYNSTVLGALKEAADALSTVSAAQRHLDETAQAWASAKRSRAAAEGRFKAGLINRIALLDTIDNEIEQHSRHSEALSLQRLAYAELNTALGSGLAPRTTPQQGQL